MTDPDPLGIAAYQAQLGAPGRRCTRTTSTGRPCKKRPVRGAATASPWLGELWSCRQHLTADEKARAQADADREERERVLRQDVPPACWLWAVPHGFDLTDPRQALREWQAGLCGVCGHIEDDLQEDHDHRTGMVRGWLCRSCNVREGNAGATPSRFTYWRQRPAAAVLGVSYRYVSPIFGPDYGDQDTEEQKDADARHAARTLGNLWHRDRALRKATQ